MATTCRRPVEVLAKRTEFSQTFANPDGTSTLETSLVPKRVRQGTQWVPVDTTLRKAAGGVAPRASALPMVFSGGGRGPLARLTNRGRELSVSWPGALPAPEVSGATALYRDVLPGVDLRLTAEALGFAEVLVVRTPEAAADPRLASLRFGLATKGVTVTATEGGGLEARDDRGGRVFASPAPLMWDSSDVTRPGQDAKAQPGHDVKARPGRGVRTMPVRVANNELVLTPDRRMLTDPATRFPVHIDPSWTGYLQDNAWTMVWSNFPNSSFWQNGNAVANPANGDAGAGLVRDCTGCSNYLIRSMFRMNTVDIMGKDILGAQFRITQGWSWTCSPGSDAGLWLTSEISPGTTWNAQPAWGLYGLMSTSAANHRTDGAAGCLLPGPVEFDVTAMVQLAAANWWPNLTVGLRAVDEGTVWQWKKFYHDTAVLSVTYNTPPNEATNRLSDGAPCGTGSGRPYVLTTTPVLSATQSDPDTDQQALGTWFYWWPVVGGTRSDTNRVAQSAGNPSTVAAMIPAGRLVDGSSYVWQALTVDPYGRSTWSGTCEFTVDATPPPTPGGVSSTDYPADGQPHGGVGLDGVFSIVAPALRPYEVVAYAWTLDSGVQPSAAPTVPARTTDYGATVTIRPVRDGVNTLRVWAKDQAGRFSATPATWTFTVRAGSGPAAEWTFNESSGAATDVTGHGNPASLSGGATRTPGRGGVGSALSLNGTTGYAATTGPVQSPHPDTGVPTPVRTDTSFTITARVRLTATGGTGKPTAVGADGTRTSAFVLGYSGPNNRWRFAMAGADSDSPTVFAVLSDAAPTAGKWTHLAAVYDASNRQLRLYVNGALQAATATLTGGFNATGPVSIGRGRWAGANSDFLDGAIDDVRVYGFVETQPKLAALAAPLPPTVSFPAGATATAGTTLQVTFAAGGDTNVTSFKYSVGDSGLGLTATPSTPGGPITVTVPAGTIAGERPVYAASAAGASLVGPSTVATFTVTSAARVTGGVFDNASFLPVSGAVVTLSPGGLQVVTGADGGFVFTGFAPGHYTVAATFGGLCGSSASQEIDVDGDVYVELILFPLADGTGYTCTEQAIGFVQADATVLALSGDDAVAHVALPFAFPFYGSAYYDAWVDTNGIVSFTDPGGSHPNGGAVAMPDAASPNAVVAPFWDDLVVDGSASVRTASVGAGSGQQFVIEWRNVYRKGNATQRLSFETLLAKDGTVTTNYASLDDDAERGGQAVVGIESPTGDDALSYSTRQPVLLSGQAVVFDYPGEASPIQVFDLSGTLVDATGAAVVGATVSISPRGWSTTTGAGGAWSFTGLVADSYTITSSIGGRCAASVTTAVDLTANAVRNLQLTPDYGAMGYACTSGASGYTAASTVVALSGDDARTSISLPFPFTLHGRTYTTAWASTNGLVIFGDDPGTATDVNVPLPTAAAPNAVVAPFWDDLVVDASATVRTQVLGSAPNRQFAVEWRNAVVKPGTDRVTFEVMLQEDGRIGFHYGSLSTAAQRGSGATVGLEDASGTVAARYSHNEVALNANSSIVFTAAAPGTISGTVTETVTTQTIAGATVTLTPGGASTTTAADGSYQFGSVPVGQYVVSASVGSGPCAGQYAIATVFFAGGTADADLSIAGGGDASGYTCTETTQAFLPAAQAIALSGDDVIVRNDPPFPVALYGATYTSAWIDTNGAISFINPPGSAWDSSPIPSPAAPGRHNAALYPFWDDWVVDAQASVRQETVGTTPNRKWIVEWRNVASFHDGSARASFEVIFEESGGITFAYNDIDAASAIERGGFATVGIEDPLGTTAFQYLRAQTWLASGRGIRFVQVGVAGGTVTGTVTCQGSTVAGASVAVGGHSTVTAANGSYALTGVPSGAYSVIATPAAGACSGSHTAPVTVGGGTQSTVDFTMAATPPEAGYTVVEQSMTFIAANGAVVPLTGDDDYIELAMPFAVGLYGQSYSNGWVDTNGVISFVDPGGAAYDFSAIPSPPVAHRPNAALYPLWDDWIVDAQASVRTATIGAAPNRRFVVEWRNVRSFDDANNRVTFEVIFDEAGGYTFAYTDLDGGALESGGGATIGIENATGAVALQYSYNHPVARPGVGVRFNPPA